MPAKPAWFEHLDRIIAALRSLPSPFLDRQAIENLFGVQERRARQILLRFAPVVQIGNAAAVRREDLLCALEAYARGEVVAGEHLRRTRTAEALRRAAQDSPARHIPVATSSSRLERRFCALPPTIVLSPGRLEVRFRTPNDLWSQLAELAAAAASDRIAFLHAVSPPEPASD